MADATPGVTGADCNPEQIEREMEQTRESITAKVSARNLRIYETGISYSGRTYAEGKKIGWRDGVQAVQCILRYSPMGTRLRRLTGS